MPTYGKIRVFFDGAGDAGGDGGDGGAGDGGNGGTPTFDGATYTEHLPDDIRTNPTIAKYGTLEELARGAIHSQQMLGNRNNLVQIPDAGDSEGRRGLLQQLGLPAELTDNDYQFDTTNIPEEIRGDGAFLTEFRTKAHELGIMPDQYSGIVEWFFGQSGSTLQTETQAVEAAALEDLRSIESEWGKEGTPSFNERVAAANFAVDKLGGADLQDVINEAGLGRNPTIMFALEKVGRILSEDGGDFSSDNAQPGTGTTGGRFNNSLTPDQARSQARQLQQDAMQHLYKNPMEAKRLNQEAQRLYQVAQGGR